MIRYSVMESSIPLSASSATIFWHVQHHLSKATYWHVLGHASVKLDPCIQGYLHFEADERTQSNTMQGVQMFSPHACLHKFGEI